MKLVIGVALLFAIVGAAVYLVCVQPTKAAFAELARITFFVGLFFVVWALSGSTWSLT